MPASRRGRSSSIPDLPEDEAYERLWSELEHVLRLDEPDPAAAWEERMDVLNDVGQAAHRAARSTRSSCAVPARSSTVGLLPTHRWWAADFVDREGPAPLPEPADRRGLHDARPDAHVGSRHGDEAARAARRDDHPRPARSLRGRQGSRDRRRRERRGAALAAHGRRRRAAARRARARRPAGPHRPARDRVLRHAARRERGEPHRVRQRLPVPRRGRRRRSRQLVRARTSTS